MYLYFVTDLTGHGKKSNKFIHSSIKLFTNQKITLQKSKERLLHNAKKHILEIHNVYIKKANWNMHSKYSKPLRCVIFDDMHF